MLMDGDHLGHRVHRVHLLQQPVWHLARVSRTTVIDDKSLQHCLAWTTCPYVARDGKVNPDRNQLHGLSQLNSFAQATIDNTLAFLLDHDQNLASKAAQFIDVFFLQSSTAMNPRLDWGQTVRGPSQHGSYMGILDFRVLIKVVNAIQILRLSRSPYWSKDRDARMITWAQSYLDWLDSSELGKRPKRSANNHSTFYYGQVAALRILTLDEIGALNAVQTYFGGPFQEQIVSSGEQVLHY